VFKATGVAFLEKTDRLLPNVAAQADSVIRASGMALPGTNAVTEIEKRMTALEAAKIRAMANLAEKVRGTIIKKITRSEDMRFVSEDVEALVTATLQGVRVVASRYDEETGIAEVKVSVGLDMEGNIIPEKVVPMAPLYLTERKARAAAAARIDAGVRLREQIGEEYVGQVVQVKNLVLQSHRAWRVVEGMIKGAEFSKPSWPTPEKCEVKATLKVPDEEFKRLRAVTPPVR